jgi:hypothetical protein
MECSVSTSQERQQRIKTESNVTKWNSIHFMRLGGLNELTLVVILHFNTK